MAAALLPSNLSVGTPALGSSHFSTPPLVPPNIGTPTFGPVQAGTPTFGSAHVGTPMLGGSHAGTPTFGHSHFVTSPGGTGTPGYGVSGLGTPIQGPSSHGPHGIQHVVQPVICSHPSYRGPVLHSLVASKPWSPPDSAGSGPLPESPEEPDKCSTPYRLPRLSPRTTPCTEDSPLPPDTADSKVWGRFGYEDNVRMPELGPSIHRALTATTPTASALTHPHAPGGAPGTGGPGGTLTPGVGSRTVAAAQRYRQSAMIVPKFRSAAIIPSVSTGVIKDVEDCDVRVYKSLLEKVGGVTVTTDTQRDGPQDSTPTPDSGCLSPAKSIKSIHWALGSHRHPLFDYKGRSRKQGPYSREFTVHCMPPASWMRMKWGRQRVTAH